MKKNDFVRAVAKDADLTINDANIAVSAVLDNLKKLLINGDSLVFNRFCTFKVVERCGRKGRSPITGKEIWIKPYKTVKLSVSPIFKAELNSNTDK